MFADGFELCGTKIFVALCYVLSEWSEKVNLDVSESPVYGFYLEFTFYFCYTFVDGRNY